MADEDNTVSLFPDSPADELKEDILQAGQEDVDEEDTVPSDDESDDATDSEASEDADEETTFEKLAKKKGFSSPEDLAKAYTELESKNTRVEMDFASLVKTRGETTEETSTKAASDDRVLREVREVKERVEINELFGKYDDASSYAKSMADYIRSNPNASWEAAYRFVKYPDLAKHAKEEGRKEAYQNIEGKSKAKVESATKRKGKQGKDVNKLLSDPNVPLSEIEKMLPHN